MKKRENRIQKPEVRSQKLGQQAATRFSSEHGIALILTLAIITLVTVLLIGFAVSMRVENSASKNFNDVVKARELAQAALDQAVATIRQYTTRNAAPDNILNYVTFPGAVYYIDNTGAAHHQPLYSVFTSGTTDPNAQSTNLNVVSDFWITSNNGEFTTEPGSRINAGWAYVWQDPSQPPGANNPIIGRYAFWTDDESSKINVNTAALGAVPADAPFNSAPEELDLKALLPFPFANAADIQSGGLTYPRATYPYATIEEVMRSTALITPTVFNENRFSVTAYSDDKDDLDVLGRKRLDITALTKAKDIDDIIGPDSAYTRLADNTNLIKVYSSIRAFANKYPVVGGFDGLKQIIANIIAYRLNPRLPADLAQLPDAGGDPPAYLGLIKAPYVNEVKVTYLVDPVAGISSTINVELFYPYGADGSSYMTGADTVDVFGLPTVGAMSPGPYTYNIPGGVVFSAATPYYTFSFPGGADVTFAPGVPVPLLGKTVTANYKRSGTRLDCAQVPLPNVGLAPGAMACHGAEVNDPCDNENIAEWTPYRNCGGPGSGTMGPPGLSAPATSQNSVFAPGLNASKLLIRGTTSILSAGELGYIHKPGSWQYLRLQPQLAAERIAKQIPDWAMLDIFTVPNAQTQGRININSLINPEASGPSTQRLVPLHALLSGVGLTANAIDIYADDVAARKDLTLTTNPTGVDSYGMNQISTGNSVFDSIGEVCEIQSLATGADEAAKEAAIRRIANLITVRSNTFTIWIIANSIKQPPTNLTPGAFVPGTDLITGEVRAQAVVERYEDPLGTVKFRVRYFRYL